MKPHVKAFMDHTGYKPGDFIPCFRCGRESQDVDHIRAKGMGGSKLRDNPENLQAVCRQYHDWKHHKIGQPCKEKYT